MHAGTAAVAAAAAPAGAGLWLFSYNKENFQYDAGMRFGRFTMSRTFANAQVGQYREDIKGITEATISKMDAWQTITVCFLQVCAALSCAGRIGMHGAAPPGWLCALFSGCIFMSTLFCGVSLWLSMHASLRAQCAQVSLLTRKVRLPIPSMQQLDQARVLGSGFENQEMRDIFRVPFMRHPEKVPNVPTAGGGVGKKKKKGGPDPHGVHEPHAEFASTARDTVPSWIRDEVVVDKGQGNVDGEGDGKIHDESESPPHFKLLMEAQEEWRDYDVHARISMLYGVCSFLYATCYYCIGTCISELRGFWVMWSIPMVFMTAQALILRLDILRTGTHMLPNAEFLGHMAPYFAVAAASLDYRFFYSERQVAITWGLVMLTFFAHFMMALRFLDLAYPEASRTGDMPEEPGKQWWPGNWPVPQAFRKHLWFITPPKKLEDNSFGKQHCLVNEMEDLAARGGGMRKRKGSKPPAKVSTPDQKYADPSYLDKQQARKRRNDLPWQVMRVACITAALSWAFMMVATCVEVLLGPESLLKPPGEPPWIRDIKFRNWTPANMHSSASASLPGDYRLFSASTAFYDDPVATEGHASPHGDHGSHRRLASANKTARTAVLGELLKVLPLLGELAEQVSQSHHEMLVAGADEFVEPISLAPPAGFMAAGPTNLNVAWPPLFEPKHVLCGYQAGTPGHVLALTRRGFGALVSVASGDTRREAEPFSLDGVHEPIAGASWGRHGLQLVSSRGKLIQCPGGAPVMGVWSCETAQHLAFPLPTRSDIVAAAFKEADADAKDASAGPLLALIFKNLPKLVMLYSSNGGIWRPSGEVHLPIDDDNRVGLNFHGEDLLISTATGEIHRRSLERTHSSVFAAPPLVTGRHFTSACPTSGKGFVRLGLRQMLNDGGIARSPELVFSD